MPGLGWDPDSAVRAQARMLSQGRYCVVMAPRKAPRPAVSLAKFKLRDLQQGQAGTCWCHSPVALFEITAKVLGREPFPACRRYVGYAAKQMYEGGGNMSDGGSPTDALTVMTARGVGIAHEDLAPYSDDVRILGTRPPAAVIDDARRSHLVAPVNVRDIDEVITLIDGGHPVCNGFPCPAELQQRGITFIGRATRPVGGHSILLTGYALPGILDASRFRWLQMTNWWGPDLYRPLPAASAARVEGYLPSSPSGTADCWIREDAYLAYCRMDGGRAEHVSATGVDGLKGGLVAPAVAGADFDDALF
jgi:hypothetical protein